MRQLQRLFRRHLGMTPTQYFLKARLQRARHLLQFSALSVTEIAIATGPNNTPGIATANIARAISRSSLNPCARNNSSNPIRMNASPMATASCDNHSRRKLAFRKITNAPR